MGGGSGTESGTASPVAEAPPATHSALDGDADARFGSPCASAAAPNTTPKAPQAAEDLAGRFPVNVPLFPWTVAATDEVLSPGLPLGAALCSPDDVEAGGEEDGDGGDGVPSCSM